jgi:hypothetical protein
MKSATTAIRCEAPMAGTNDVASDNKRTETAEVQANDALQIAASNAAHALAKLTSSQAAALETSASALGRHF